MSVPQADEDNVKISAPAASESISSASLEGPKFGSFRISSRSSLNPSARDDIQNFLNLSFMACSRASSSADRFGGRKDGISALGKEGEGDLGRGGSFSLVTLRLLVCICSFTMDVPTSSSSDSESLSEDADSDDELVSDSGCLVGRGAGF